MDRRPPRPGEGLARSVTGVLAASLTALLFAGCSPGTQTDSPAETSIVTASNVTLTAAQQQNIHLSTVALSKFHKTVDTTGAVDFDNDQATTVLAPMSGPASRLLVSLGDQVKEGQPLAEVDSPDFAIAISTYQKALATAKITRELAEQDQQLIERHGISLREADQARIDATNAAADAEAALRQLVSLKVDPETIKAVEEGKASSPVPALIRSPLAGTVVEKLITPGELLQAATTPCFTVADLSQMWVLADLYDSDLSSVALGDTAEVVTSAASNSFPGVVDNISAFVDPNTRSIAVRVLAKNPGGILKKLMYVRVLIHSRNESAALLVPVSAVLRDSENLPFVYLAQPGGRFARGRITLGARVGGQYEITSGLKEGDQIVMEGGLFVQFLQDQ